METEKVEQTAVNDGRTSGRIDTRLTHRPVRYELIGNDSRCYGSYATAELAAKFAQTFWPDQEQDPDRTGKGWDVQVVGS